ALRVGDPGGRRDDLGHREPRFRPSPGGLGDAPEERDRAFRVARTAVFGRHRHPHTEYTVWNFMSPTTARCAQLAEAREGTIVGVPRRPEGDLRRRARAATPPAPHGLRAG